MYGCAKDTSHTQQVPNGMAMLRMQSAGSVRMYAIEACSVVQVMKTEDAYKDVQTQMQMGINALREHMANGLKVVSCSTV